MTDQSYEKLKEHYIEHGVYDGLELGLGMEFLQLYFPKFMNDGSIHSAISDHLTRKFTSSRAEEGYRRYIVEWFEENYPNAEVVLATLML